MAQLIRFVKMHGIGNDYIFVDTTRYPIADPASAARLWSRPHTGVGADGLVLIGRPADGVADLEMRIFNADGSEGLMCGNASRCIGKWAYERGLTEKTRLRLLTASGIRVLELNVDSGGRVADVTVDMMAPMLSDSRLFRQQGGALPEGVFVSMGNPHYVIFVDDIDAVDVSAEGRRLEHHERFPQRCNIEFAQVREPGIRMRVWERGSGITQACGTGACATAVAAALTGRCGRSTRIIMDGGTLDVEWRADRGHVYLCGPASIVFEGELELPE